MRGNDDSFPLMQEELRRKPSPHKPLDVEAAYIVPATSGASQRAGTSESTPDDPSLIGTGAVKYDAGKPCVWQGVINYFPRALWGVAEISTFGAEKYAWNGWEDVEDGYARYQNAKCRHMLKEAMGEEMDPDSKLFHLKHEAWGALAALELYLRENEDA